MATLVVTSIMVDSDDPALVNQAIKGMLRSAVFESANPIVDFAISLQQTGIEIQADHEEGELTVSIQDAHQIA